MTVMAELVVVCFVLLLLGFVLRFQYYCSDGPHTSFLDMTALLKTLLSHQDIKKCTLA